MENATSETGGKIQSEYLRTFLPKKWFLICGGNVEIPRACGECGSHIVLSVDEITEIYEAFQSEKGNEPTGIDRLEIEVADTKRSIERIRKVLMKYCGPDHEDAIGDFMRDVEAI